ncbi:hypothetical protein Gohar_017193, partial [Gossypium harknessii]|nr:hypothetical protein [Gossypium harknessii]
MVTCLQQLAHMIGSTILVSILQPTLETFDLFDDIILMAEGKIVYHGVRSDVRPFFEHCGLSAHHGKVLSEEDQAQYWYHMDRPHTFVSSDKFVAAFNEIHTGQKLNQDLFQPFTKAEDPKNALSYNIYSLGKWELIKLLFLAMVAISVFIRTRMKIDEVHASQYLGSLFYGLLRLTASGISELALTGSRFGVFYKQSDLLFYPVWAYSISSTILRIPFSFLDAFLWTSLVYYAIGYSPEPESIDAWLDKMGFWMSPMTYAEIGVSVNEFHAPRWQKVSSSKESLGQQVLIKHGLKFNEYLYWISFGALVGMCVLYNLGFTLALSYLK